MITKQRKEQQELQKDSIIPTKIQKTRKKQVKNSNYIIITMESEQSILIILNGRRIQFPRRFVL